MATTADSSSNHHSPRGSGFSGDGVSSPQFRRRNFPSAWAQIVRGDHEPIPAANLSSSSSASSPVTSAPPEQPSFSDCSPPKEVAAAADNSVPEDSSDSNSGNAARQKKPAWNKPSNGVVEVGPVMGADSWPALSESARVSPKSVPDSSSKPISDGSVSVSQAPAILHSPQKQATTNANPSSTPNHALPVRQRSIRRGGGGTGVGGGPMQSGFPITPPPPPPLPPPPFPVFEMTQNTYGKLVPAPVPDSSPREPAYRGNNWETRPIGGFVSQPHAVNDHPSPRNSSRRGNYGPHPRGDGQYHNNYGGRRDHDRGNQDWNSRNSNQPHRAPPRNFVRHPQSVSAPFIATPPARPFGNPMAFTDMTSPVYILPALPPESFRGVPFVTHAPPPPVFFPLPDPNLHTLLVNQIDYYFSDANLIKDEFLKSNMDELGWVPIALIASFPRVKNLTHSIQLILESLRTSTVVEVKDDKVRRSNEWMRWIPTSSRVSTDSGLQSPGGYNMLATSFQRVTLEEMATNQNSIMGYTDPHPEAVLGRSSSEELTGQSQHSNGEGTDQATSSNQV